MNLERSIESFPGPHELVEMAIEIQEFGQCFQWRIDIFMLIVIFSKSVSLVQTLHKTYRL